MNMLDVLRKQFPSLKLSMIVDAKKSIALDVTEVDVKRAVPKDHNSCAFAQCVKRTTDVDAVFISRRVAYLAKGKVVKRYIIPAYANIALTKLDWGLSFPVGIYTLLAPRGTQRLGHHSKSTVFHPDGRHYPKRERPLLVPGIRTALIKETR